MDPTEISFRRIGAEEKDAIRALFLGVFTAAPWNDDWSDREQLNLYLDDLISQNNSLTYGLYKGGGLIGVSMGHIRHWYEGTEYYIDELCIRTDQQGRGTGTRFLSAIEAAVRDIGLTRVFLQTERNVPAYRFYLKNGYHELKDHVSFDKAL